MMWIIGLCGGSAGGFDLQSSLLATPFSRFDSLTLNGDFAVGATSLSASGSGSITISGIPAGATIEKAYLFYSFQDNGGSVSGSFNGNPISGIFLGSDCTSCWGTSSTSLYWADVSLYVSGNGTYNLSGFDPLECPSGSHGVEGAALVVIYSEPSEPTRHISIYSGVWETSCSGASYSWTHDGFVATNPVNSAKYAVVIGNGQDFGESSTENISVNSNIITTDIDGNTPPAGPCSNGSLFDLFTGDATSYMTGGDMSVSFSVYNGPQDASEPSWDCFHPILSVFSITVEPTDIDENRTANGPKEYRIYTVDGRLIYTGKSIPTLPKGIYFYTDGKRRGKIIVN